MGSRSDRDEVTRSVGNNHHHFAMACIKNGNYSCGFDSYDDFWRVLTESRGDQILAHDAEFYQPSITIEAIPELNRFVQTVGLLSSPVAYDQVVAMQFRSLWSE